MWSESENQNDLRVRTQAVYHVRQREIAAQVLRDSIARFNLFRASSATSQTS